MSVTRFWALAATLTLGLSAPALFAQCPYPSMGGCPTTTESAPTKAKKSKHVAVPAAANCAGYVAGVCGATCEACDKGESEECETKESCGGCCKAKEGCSGCCTAKEGCSGCCAAKDCKCGKDCKCCQCGKEVKSDKCGNCSKCQHCDKCDAKADKGPSGKSEQDKGGESLSVCVEDVTLNYFGAGVKIKKIKVRYKGDAIDPSEVAKDLSSISCPAPVCCPPCPMPICAPACCVPPPPPPFAAPRISKPATVNAN